MRHGVLLITGRARMRQVTERLAEATAERNAAAGKLRCATGDAAMHMHMPCTWHAHATCHGWQAAVRHRRCGRRGPPSHLHANSPPTASHTRMHRYAATQHENQLAEVKTELDEVVKERDRLTSCLIEGANNADHAAMQQVGGWGGDVTGDMAGT